MAFCKVIVIFAMFAVFAAAIPADVQPKISEVTPQHVPVSDPKEPVPESEQTRAKKYAVYSTYSSYALPPYYGGYPITSYSSYIHKPLPYAYSAAYYPAPYYTPYIL